MNARMKTRLIVWFFSKFFHWKSWKWDLRRQNTSRVCNFFFQFCSWLFLVYFLFVILCSIEVYSTFFSFNSFLSIQFCVVSNHHSAVSLLLCWNTTSNVANLFRIMLFVHLNFFGICAARRISEDCWRFDSQFRSLWRCNSFQNDTRCRIHCWIELIWNLKISWW